MAVSKVRLRKIAGGEAAIFIVPHRQWVLIEVDFVKRFLFCMFPFHVINLIDPNELSVAFLKIKIP